jgi:hypothetical protein
MWNFPSFVAKLFNLKVGSKRPLICSSSSFSRPPRVPSPRRQSTSPASPFPPLPPLFRKLTIALPQPASPVSFPLARRFSSSVVLDRAAPPSFAPSQTNETLSPPSRATFTTAGSTRSRRRSWRRARSSSTTRTICTRRFLPLRRRSLQRSFVFFIHYIAFVVDHVSLSSLADLEETPARTGQAFRLRAGPRFPSPQRFRNASHERYEGRERVHSRNLRRRKEEGQLGGASFDERGDFVCSFPSSFAAYC